MAATLPGHLQDNFRSWSEQKRSHFLEFETESGKITRSKMPGSASAEVTAECICNREHADDWEEFYSVSCSEGATAFYMEDPRTNSLGVFFFASPPRVTYLGPISGATGPASNLVFSVSLALVRE